MLRETQVTKDNRGVTPPAGGPRSIRIMAGGAVRGFKGTFLIEWGPNFSFARRARVLEIGGIITNLNTIELYVKK